MEPMSEETGLILDFISNSRELFTATIIASRLGLPPERVWRSMYFLYKHGYIGRFNRRIFGRTDVCEFFKGQPEEIRQGIKQAVKEETEQAKERLRRLCIGV